MKSRVFESDKYNKEETDAKVNGVEPTMHAAGYRVINWATVTIAPDAWDTAAKTATVSVAGVKPESSVTVSYEPSTKKVFQSAMISADSLGDGTVTFSCARIPTESVGVNIEVKN